MHAPRRRSALGLLLTAVLAVSVGPAGTVLAQADEAATGPELEEIVVGLGFIPSVQFAQFYLADEAGYYEAAGLDVTLQNEIDADLIRLLGTGAVDIGMADGTSLIPAVSQGIPVVYTTTIYGRFPNVVIAPLSSGISEVADLAGKRVGTPGRFGSSWTMLEALLGTAGLGIDDVEIVLYPDFGQAIGLAEGQVDVATGFANNEPVQLAREGIDSVLLRVDDVAPLPGNGLVVGRSTLEEKPDALRAFTAATLRAMQEIADDPQLGLEATFARIPELAEDPETQLAILEATVDMWFSDHAVEHGLGTIDTAAWESALEILSALPDAVVAEDLTVDTLVTDALQPAR